MSELNEWGIRVEDARAIGLFRFVAGEVDSLNYELKDQSPTPETFKTKAGRTRILKMYVKTKAIHDRRNAAIQRLGELAKPVLKLFKEKKLDASAIFSFMVDAGQLRPDRKPVDPVRTALHGALSNLYMMLAPGNEVPPTPKVPTGVSEGAMALLPLLDPITYRKIGAIAAKAKMAGLNWNRDTISAYLKELESAGLAEKNPDGHGYRRITSPA